MAVKRQIHATHALAATKGRTFRSFLLMEQFAAAEIGQRIRDARLAAGLTQEELAEMASFSKRSLTDYETGVTLPYRHLRELGRLLSREVEWFLYGEKDQPGSDAAELTEALHRLRGEMRETRADLSARLDRLEVLVDQAAPGTPRTPH